LKALGHQAYWPDIEDLAEGDGSVVSGYFVLPYVIYFYFHRYLVRVSTASTEQAKRQEK
jgi:hypothetical protein